MAWSNHDGAEPCTRSMLVDQKGLGMPPVFIGKEEGFCVWGKKVENCVSGVFPNVRGALSFAVESEDVVTTAAVALGVPGFGTETSAELDGQLFLVLSAFADGVSFDVVMSAGGDRGFGSWRKLHKRWSLYTAGLARSLLREIASPPRWTGGRRLVGKGHHRTPLHTLRAGAQAQSLEPFSLSLPPWPCSWRDALCSQVCCRGRGWQAITPRCPGCFL